MQTKNLILRLICLIYLIAFCNFLKQNSGLFGDDGILPARVLLEGKTHRYNIFNYPTLKHFAGILGGDIASTMDLVAIIGMAISLAGFVSQKFCIFPTFVALWILYFSLVQVLQVFIHQSDMLLLEAGFYCLMLTPFFHGGKRSPVDGIGLLMIRYLLFRFMFASGAVKLVSGCPFWWNLQGLKQHFETLPLPTFLSWYAFHMPEPYLKLSTIFVYLSELVCPWLFFAPNKTVRKFAFYWQIFLQFHIIVTGNYGFLNFLITALLFSLLNSVDLSSGKRKDKTRDSLGLVATGMVIACISYLCLKYFGLAYDSGEIQTKILFTKAQFMEVLKVLVQLGPLVATVAVILVFLKTIISNQITHAGNLFKKLLQILNLLFFTIIAVGIIALSTVPHGNITPSTNITQTPMGKYYRTVYPFKIINEYGLHLRKMRPSRMEIVFEHAQSVDGPWKEYPYLYKPYDTKLPLPFCGPYFPRFDFKLYDAADSTYWHEIWLNSVAFRLLQNKKDVLNLFGIKQKIRPEPVYVRAVLYKFKYTPWTNGDGPYWTRQIYADYFPPLALNDTTLHSQMKKLQIPLSGWTTKTNYSNLLKQILDFIQAQINMLEGSFFLFAVIAAAFAIIIVQKSIN